MPVTILIVLLVLGLALYGLRFLPLDGTIQQLLAFALVVIAIIYILRAAGVA